MSVIMDSYVLFRNNKRLNMREDDLQANKMARIFQVWYVYIHRLIASTLAGDSLASVRSPT